MTETAAPVPTAVPNAAAPAPVATAVAVPDVVPDPALDGFAKVAAERRTRAVAENPYTAVPFGSGTIRIYSSLPANWAFLAANAQEDPGAAFGAIREAIIEQDRAEFDRIKRLPPDNPEGIDGEFLVGFLGALSNFYGGVPTNAS